MDFDTRISHPLHSKFPRLPFLYTQTFPVWTQETLRDLRQRKVKAEEIAVECMERLKEETRKMEETNNPLMKAMHFRNGKYEREVVVGDRLSGGLHLVCKHHCGFNATSF